MSKPSHLYTDEVIRHFRCDKCKKWWSVADWNKAKLETQDLAYCALCGHGATMEELTNADCP